MSFSSAYTEKGEAKQPQLLSNGINVESKKHKIPHPLHKIALLTQSSGLINVHIIFLLSDKDNSQTVVDYIKCAFIQSVNSRRRVSAGLITLEFANFFPARVMKLAHFFNDQQLVPV